MPAVSLLFLNDDVVAPHLELLRRVCDSKSKSQPHITVRYFDKLSVPDRYKEKEIEYVDLLEPGAYGLDDADRPAVVFIRCLSEDLLSLEHKPHFPTSDFHITLYEGNDKTFAMSFYLALREFKWRFRLNLVKAKLSVVALKGKATYGPPAPRSFSESMKGLFKQITGVEFQISEIDGFSRPVRLALSRRICAHLHEAVKDYHRPPPFLAAEEPSIIKRSTEIEPLSVHLTPPELAFDIAQFAYAQVPPSMPVHFGDPAVGTGVFFSALLQVCPRDRLRSAIGIDVSREQVAAAHWRWAQKGMEVRLADYLHLERLPKRTLILANPPYLRHQYIPAKYKQELCERASVQLGYRVSGRSGLYAYFLLLGHEWMEPNAISAWLIPSEFMVTDYGSALRFYLSRRVELIRIHTFGPDIRQFENAEVLPSIVIFRNRVPSLDAQVLFTVGGTLNSPVTTETVLLRDLSADQKWKLPFKDRASQRSSGFRIKDLFKIRRGIATGANDFFILERKVARELGLPEIALKPVLPKSRVLNEAVIQRDSDGYPKVEPKLCVIDCSLTETEIARKYRRLARYLSTAKDRNILKRNLIRNRTPWYKQEVRAPAPFLCTYMGRGRKGLPPIHFYWNKSDAIATNTYLMLYPNPSLAKILEENEKRGEELLDMLQKAARTTVLEQSRLHAGGLRKIEPKELGNVTLLDVPAWVPQSDSSLFLEI